MRGREKKKLPWVKNPHLEVQRGVICPKVSKSAIRDRWSAHLASRTPEPEKVLERVLFEDRIEKRGWEGKGSKAFSRDMELTLHEQSGKKEIASNFTEVKFEDTGWEQKREKPESDKCSRLKYGRLQSQVVG